MARTQKETEIVEQYLEDNPMDIDGSEEDIAPVESMKMNT